MKFLVATYGEKHIGMLLAHVHAIRRIHPDAGIEVYHQDLPARQFEALAKTYPEVKWIETKFNFATDKIQRISSKTLAWEYAIRQQPEGEEVCLLDVDTLVIKDLRPFFADPSIDVIFTYKPAGGFVLNSGVMLCRATAGTLAFFERWREETVKILKDPELFNQANDSKLPYGGGDQMSLHQILGYRCGQTTYDCEIAGQRVRFHGEPCEVLNEIRSVPITDRTHLIHYKGGWQPILLEGRAFSKYRPKADCWEMYLLYLDTFEEALRTLNERAGTAWTARDFHLAIPGYVREPAGSRRQLSYGFFVACNRIRSTWEFWQAGCRFLARKAGLLPKTC